MEANRLQSKVGCLLAPEPDRAAPTRAWRLIAVLMIAAFVPRLVMAIILPTICVDGVGYVDAAIAIEQSDQGLIGPLYRLNTFPIVLAGLFRLGLPWETAGKLWGVLCSVLVVPALFGWVRREFDDRTAVVACLLYAAHAKLIEWSPEIIRDSTFWLLFSWTIYFSWRAAAEVRLRHFAAVAVLLPLSAITRFEGAFLCLPHLGWAVVRFAALRSSRPRLIAGLAISLLPAPLVLVAVNAFWLKHDSSTQLLYTEPLRRVVTLTAELVQKSKAAGPEFPSTARPSPFSETVLKSTAYTIERGITPYFALFMLVGAIRGRRRFFARDQWPLWLYALALVGGTWIHMWYCRGASSRYVLTLAILGTRLVAPVCLDLAAFLAGRMTLPVIGRRWAFSGIAVLMFTGCIDAWTTGYESRIAKADLGRYIRRHYGENARLIGIDDQLSIVGYYAETTTAPLPVATDAESLVETVRAMQPDVLLFSENAITETTYRRLAEGDAGVVMEPITAVHVRPGTLVLGRDTLRR